MKNLRIEMNLDQYIELTDLICFAYDNGYYHNRFNTVNNVFDDMVDSVKNAKIQQENFNEKNLSTGTV